MRRLRVMVEKLMSAVEAARERWADLEPGEIVMLRERVAELEEQVARLSAPHQAGPCGDVYFYQCSRCQKEKTIDISPARVAENHATQLAEDAHRSWLIELGSPEADRARAIAAAEAIENAEAKARARARELRAEALEDAAQVATMIFNNRNGNGARS